MDAALEKYIRLWNQVSPEARNVQVDRRGDVNEPPAQMLTLGKGTKVAIYDEAVGVVAVVHLINGGTWNGSRLCAGNMMLGESQGVGAALMGIEDAALSGWGDLREDARGQGANYVLLVG